MSLLGNPSFEDSTTDIGPWQRLNEPQAVNFSVITNAAEARSGSNYLSFRTATPGGSIAQDVVVSLPSVTALAFIRASTGTVNGTFAIWDLDANRNINKGFSVGTDWVQLVLMLSLTGANRPIRVEMYIDTINADLFMDNVNAW